MKASVLVSHLRGGGGHLEHLHLAVQVVDLVVHVLDDLEVVLVLTLQFLHLDLEGRERLRTRTRRRRKVCESGKTRKEGRSNRKKNIEKKEEQGTGGGRVGRSVTVEEKRKEEKDKKR